MWFQWSNQGCCNDGQTMVIQYQLSYNLYGVCVTLHLYTTLMYPVSGCVRCGWPRSRHGSLMISRSMSSTNTRELEKHFRPWLSEPQGSLLVFVRGHWELFVDRASIWWMTSNLAQHKMKEIICKIVIYRNDLHYKKLCGSLPAI